MDPSTSNVVLLSMITKLQGEIDASEARATQLESLREAQASVIRSLRDDLTASTHTIRRITTGAEVLTRGLDAMYNKAKLMYERMEMNQEDWSDFYRFMLRADLGFALMHGADYVDLTTDEDMEDGNTTVMESDPEETESEMEDNE